MSRDPERSNVEEDLSVAQDAIIGREAELAAIAWFVDRVPSGPRALLLEGEPGIGKTTLWRAALSAARERGVQVLTTRASASEARLSFSALDDLLARRLDDILPHLPGPQRRALEVALLRTDAKGQPPDLRAVSVAALSGLRQLALRAPVLIAIDDIQWLDPSSARVLSFVVRRLEDEPVGIAAVLRTAPGLSDPLELWRSLPEPRVERLGIGSLDERGIGKLLRSRLGEPFPRPIVRRIHASCAGNPFYALEIAIALLRRCLPLTPAEPLPTPHSLEGLLRARLAGLADDTRDVLLLAAAASRPTITIVRTASREPDVVVPALWEARDAELVELEGDAIRFTHPLFAAAVYGESSPDRRREVHGRLAGVVADPEERARHLAISSSGPDESVASTAESAGRHAELRGAIDAAASLLELATELTPLQDVDGRLRRARLAAAFHFEAGNPSRARELIGEALKQPGGYGPLRAALRILNANTRWNNVRFVMQQYQLAEQEAGDDPSTSLAIHMQRAWALVYAGELANARQEAVEAVAIAQRLLTGPSQRDQQLIAFRARFAYSILGLIQALGGHDPSDAFSHAFAIEAPIPIWGTGTAPMTRGTVRAWWGDLAGARADLEGEDRHFSRIGRETSRWEILGPLAELECRAGNLPAAARYAEEMYSIAMEAGLEDLLDEASFYRAMVLAFLGETDEARVLAEAGLAIAEASGDLYFAAHNRSVLGFVESSLGNHRAAHGYLGSLVDVLEGMGIVEPGAFPFLPDEIESLIGLGELDRAEELRADLEERGRALDRPWAIATGSRCRGLLLAARGDLPGALDALAEALREHKKVDQPFELGRTLLAKGEVERRMRQKREARSSLEKALRIFDELGARLWSERARADLERVGGPAAPAGELTPTERRVANLVSEGLSNREIAEALFISVKTVEANLSRVYHKTGVRSRAELIRQLLGGRSIDDEGTKV